MDRGTPLAATVAALLMAGCSGHLDRAAADAASDTSEAPDANDAADGSECPGQPPWWPCIDRACFPTSMVAAVCTAGRWVCPAGYQFQDAHGPNACCFPKTCLSSSGTVFTPPCTFGVYFCPDGSTEIVPDAG